MGGRHSIRTRAHGHVRSRLLSGAVHETALSGAPEGQYVVIRYRRCIGYRERALESVTPMLEQDGSWRVSGYFIQ